MLVPRVPSNTNVGTLTKPWATADKLANSLKAGQTGPRDLSPAPTRAPALLQFSRLLEGSLTPDQVLAEMVQSGLRGRGGAGFPAGIKWRTVAQTPPQQKDKQATERPDDGHQRRAVGDRRVPEEHGSVTMMRRPF